MDVSEYARRGGYVAVFRHFFADALPTAAVAVMLGHDVASIRQRLREGSLVALAAGGTMRVPALQFHQGVEVPGLARVLRALPARLGPLDVLLWLDTPAPCWAGADGQPRSPRDYLVQTGMAESVVAAAQRLPARHT